MGEDEKVEETQAEGAPANAGTPEGPSVDAAE